MAEQDQEPRGRPDRISQLESGSEAGQLHGEEALLGGKKKGIFCEGFVKENRNSQKYGLRPKISTFCFCSNFFRFQKKLMIFFYDLEVKSPCGSIPAI